MVCELTERDLSDVFLFCWPICKDQNTTSYPIYPEPGDLQNALIGSMRDPNDKVLGCFEKEELIGVCMVFPISQDHFLQTNGFYIEGKTAGYDVDATQFVRYLKNHYPGYRALFGFPRENRYAAMYFYEHGAKCVESSYTLICTRTRYQPEKPGTRNPVKRLKPEDFPKYAPFHDQFAGEIYWNAERMQRDLAQWWIYTYESKGEIVASLFMHVENRMDAEIFGLFVAEGKDVYYYGRKLLAKTLGDLFEQMPQVADVIYFVEEDSKSELKAAYETGFYKNDHYKCYQLML